MGQKCENDWRLILQSKPYQQPGPQIWEYAIPDHARHVPDKTGVFGNQHRKSKKLRKGEYTKNAI